MTLDEAINILKQYVDYDNPDVPDFYTMEEAIEVVIKALEQQPCEDAISRTAVLELVADYDLSMGQVVKGIHALPSVSPMPKMGKCKDCKYFEYDSWAKVNGIPLIVAHEICKRWGDGCKTKEDGYCFLFESKMQEVQNETNN